MVFKNLLISVYIYINGQHDLGLPLIKYFHMLTYITQNEKYFSTD